MSAKIVAVLLWVLVGAFTGMAIAPLFGATERWMQLGIIFAVAVGAAGLLERLKGKIGIPLVSLLGGLAGWMVGFVSGVWQVGALGVVIGAAMGARWGMSLQERFTRNTTRGTSARDFYR